MQQLKVSVTHHVWSHKAIHNPEVKGTHHTPQVVTQRASPTWLWWWLFPHMQRFSNRQVKGVPWQPGIPSLFSLTQNDFNQTNTKHSIYRTKVCYNQKNCIEISLCGKFKAPCVHCLPEIVKLVGAKLKCSLLPGLNSTDLVQSYAHFIRMPSLSTNTN